MTPKTRLQKQADKLWFEAYLQPKCEICDNKATQLHHYYYKSSFGHLRYDKDNGISLCQQHHFQLHHQDPKKVEYLIVKKRGSQWLEKLQQKAYNPSANFKTTIGYYKKVINQLTNK